MIRDSNIAPDAAIDATKILGASTITSVFGKTWYVDGNSANCGDTPGCGKLAHPFKTLAYALTQCGQGDYILVAENHSESVATATAFDAVDNDISIIGFGQGKRKPKITVSTLSTSTCTISGASVRVINLQFVCSRATRDLASLVTVTGADAIIQNCNFYDTGATTNPLVGITLSTGADRAKILNCEFRNTTGNDLNGAAISIGAALDRIEIGNCFIWGQWAAAYGGIYSASIITAYHIHHNTIVNRCVTTNGYAVNFTAAATGIYAWNASASYTSQGVVISTAGTAWGIESYHTEHDRTSGILSPSAT